MQALTSHRIHTVLDQSIGRPIQHHAVVCCGFKPAQQLHAHIILVTLMFLGCLLGFGMPWVLEHACGSLEPTAVAQQYGVGTITLLHHALLHPALLRIQYGMPCGVEAHWIVEQAVGWIKEVEILETLRQALGHCVSHVVLHHAYDLGIDHADAGKEQRIIALRCGHVPALGVEGKVVSVETESLEISVHI